MEMPRLRYLEGTESQEDPSVVIPESDFIRLVDHIAELESLLQGLADLDGDLPATPDGLLSLHPKVWAQG